MKFIIDIADAPPESVREVLIEALTGFLTANKDVKRQVEVAFPTESEEGKARKRRQLHGRVLLAATMKFKIDRATSE